MASEVRYDSEPLPPNCELIEVHVAELQQLFNAIDPSPFREKDLSANVEAFIMSWAKDVHRGVPLALLVHVDQPTRQNDASAMLRDAIRAFFSQRALASRQRLRQLLRVGRTSLLIGLVFLAVTVAVGGAIERALADQRLGAVLRESLLIGGWVAMWRPLEIFLYDWWPIRSEARLFDRLSAMPVRIAQRSRESATQLQ
ncbi:MAG: hypothetical protein ACT4P6_09280 [Gemmatimonadaceae bacterium]